MLWFIGLGVSGIDSISLESQKILQEVDLVYLEVFTSPISKQKVSNFKKMVKGEFKIAKRWMVEDGTEILNNAKKKKVALVSYGDPYIATTHIELRTRAMSQNIKTHTVHAASAITSIIGECGLQYYKLGRIVTIMDDIRSLTTPYYVIYKNLLDGNHTVLLLEYNQNKDYFLDPRKAIQYLIDIEKEQNRKVVFSSTFAIVASRVGFKTQSIIAGKLSSLKRIDYGSPPHTIIIPGRMHFTESDALKMFAKCVDKPTDNSAKIKKIAHQMLEKYVPMVRKAIDDISPHYENSKEIQEVLENAKLYIKDAERFLEQGKEEVAILSIGYADGLVDSLRIAKGLEPQR